MEMNAEGIFKMKLNRKYEKGNEMIWGELANKKKFKTKFDFNEFYINKKEQKCGLKIRNNKIAQLKMNKMWKMDWKEEANLRFRVEDE